MEIYRDETKTVTLRPPAGATSIVAKVYREGELLSTEQLTQSTPDSAVTIVLPYKAIRYDGPVSIVVTSTIDGEEYDKRYSLEVITPLLPFSEVALIAPGVDPKVVERSVRVIIEAYTGQRFGYEISTRSISGTGDSAVPLSNRLLRVSGIQTGGVVINYNNFGISGDGWYLEALSPEWLEIKEAPPEELWPVAVNGPIRVPSWYRSRFQDNQTYFVSGEWGYETVPLDIQEAARLLVNDYACNQSSYRDRYLDIIKASDWTLQYNPLAWAGTGNARADLILGQYKRPTMVII